jgi:hypothetical protein
VSLRTVASRNAEQLGVKEAKRILSFFTRDIVCFVVRTIDGAEAASMLLLALCSLWN